MQRTRAAPTTLDAVLERITYANQDTGYTVARVATNRSSDLLTVVGPLLGAQPGESLRLQGRWASHPQYGRQFQVEAYQTVLPATIQGMRRYLGSGLIKGIGPKMAERIVDHFGPATLDVIEQAPGPAGRGARPGSQAHRHDHRRLGRAAGHQAGHGLPPRAWACRRRWPFGSTRPTATTPSRSSAASRTGWPATCGGSGFKTADQLARSLGIPHDSPQRVKAGLQFALSQAAEDGHCYLPEAELVTKATELLEVNLGLAGRCLEELIAEEGVVAEPLPAHVSRDVQGGLKRAVWLIPFHRAETALGGGLLRLLDVSVDRLASFQAVDWPLALDWLHQTTGVTLAPEQEVAVRLALTERVAVLTGGPGCGKSYTVRAIVALARAKHAKILLAAPTGQAAKRLSELAGLEAATPCTGCCSCAPVGMPPSTATIPWTPTWWWSTKPPCWMCCWPTSSSRPSPQERTCCWSATWTSCPALGPGRCCGSLLAAERLPRVRLTHVFRQAQQSGVVNNAHRINAGKPPITHGLADFFLFVEEEAEQVADLVVDIVANRLPRRFGLNARDVQVLCPMHRGPAGAGGAERAAAGGPDPARDGSLSVASGAVSTGSATRSCSCATTTTRARPGCSTARSGRSPPSRSRIRSCGSC